ncbi:unnamed protein product, partial [Sphacelaria rigidula]
MAGVKSGGVSGWTTNAVSGALTGRATAEDSGPRRGFLETHPQQPYTRVRSRALAATASSRDYRLRDCSAERSLPENLGGVSPQRISSGQRRNGEDREHDDRDDGRDSNAVGDQCVSRRGVRPRPQGRQELQEGSRSRDSLSGLAEEEAGDYVEDAAYYTLRGGTPSHERPEKQRRPSQARGECEHEANDAEQSEGEDEDRLKSAVNGSEGSSDDHSGWESGSGSPGSGPSEVSPPSPTADDIVSEPLPVDEREEQTEQDPGGVSRSIAGHDDGAGRYADQSESVVDD